MKISLILLAAGNSRRFGENKLLFPIEGKPMYQHIATTIANTHIFFEKILVTQYPDLLDDSIFRDYRAVYNDHSDWGISYSVRLGVENASMETEAFCFLVCDQPYITSQSIEAFVHGFEASGCSLGTVACGDTQGNPTLFSIKYKNELLALTGDVGGRRIIRSAPPSQVYIHQIASQKELLDIDTK